MVRNNLICFAVNLGLGILFFIITVMAYFGGFDSHSGIISGEYRYYFAITLFVIGCGVFFIVGTYLNRQNSILRNIISVISPAIWIAYAELLSFLFLTGQPKGFVFTFITICSLSNIMYPITKIIEFENYHAIFRYSMMVLTIILPSLIMWLGMEYRSFKMKIAK